MPHFALAQSDERTHRRAYDVPPSRTLGRPLVVARVGTPSDPRTGQPLGPPLTEAIFDELERVASAISFGPRAETRVILDWNHQADPHAGRSAKTSDEQKTYGEVIDLYREGDALVMVPAYNRSGVELVAASGGVLWTSPCLIFPPKGVHSQADGRRLGSHMLTSVALTGTPAQARTSVDRVVLGQGQDQDSDDQNPAGGRKGEPVPDPRPTTVDTGDAANAPPNSGGAPSGEDMKYKETIEAQAATIAGLEAKLVEATKKLAELTGKTADDAAALSVAQLAATALTSQVAALSAYMSETKTKVKESAINALVLAGKLAPAEMAQAGALYDIDQTRIEAHAATNSMTLSAASAAVPTAEKLFAAYASRAPGSVVPVKRQGGGDALKLTLEGLTSEADVAAYCTAKATEMKLDFTTVFSEFAEENPAIWQAVQGVR